MNDRRHDRAFAASGVAFVVITLAAVAIGATGGRQFATIGSSPADIAKAVSDPAGAAAWAGAYLELLGFGFFLPFAVWAVARLGGGILAQIARATAVAYLAVSATALGVGDAVLYRSGHGMGLQLATTLFTLNEAVYVVTWFLASFFLLAMCPLALAAGHRRLGWSAAGVAVLTLVLIPLSLDNLAQMANFLWLVWLVAAAVTLARTGDRRSAVISPAVA